MRTATKQLHVILDAKHKHENLHKVMGNQCQHLTMTQRNKLLKLLQKIEELFGGTLDTWKTYPVDLELKKDVKPIYLQPYLVPKVHKKMFKRRLKVYSY